LGVNKQTLINQVYFNTWDGLIRLYPYVSNFPELFGNDIQIQNYNFYYLADEENNPDRDVVWTDVYLDPAGLGWVVSCIAPIYYNGKLEAVSGFDITISTMIDDLLDVSLEYQSPIFLTDANGTIMAMNEEAETLFDLKELKDHSYSDIVTGTVNKPESFQLMNIGDDVFKSQMKTIFDDNISKRFVSYGSTEYYLTKNSIDQMGWQLIVMIKGSDMLSPVEKVTEISRRVFGILFVMMIVINIVIVKMMIKRSEAMANKVTEPLTTLTQKIQRMGVDHVADYHFENTGIREIDVLNLEFYMMNKTLGERTTKLIQAELEKKEQHVMMKDIQKAARTDELTNLPNRRSIEDYLDTILNTGGYHQIISLMIFDIDHFKHVNDVYGHLTGDEVLKEIATILTTFQRDTVHISRWGGEEFMVVCSGFTLGNAVALAEQLRIAISEHEFITGKQITSSFGIAERKPNEDKRSWIQRADHALYDAKSSGRNCVRIG
jgi:diguanylate cyclase (GGDEF)-like protein